MDNVEAIDRRVLQLFQLVAEGLTAATDAFLSSDRDVARVLVEGDRSIDELESSTARLITSELRDSVTRSPDEFAMLVATLLIVPELERSGDLVEHIAMRTPQGLASQISPRARGLIGEMGRIGASMWRRAADAYRDRDPRIADELRRRDDEIDDLHVDLSAELAGSDATVAVAIEMGLIARFFERLGDHAVNISRRIRDVVEACPELAAVPAG